MTSVLEIIQTTPFLKGTFIDDLFEAIQSESGKVDNNLNEPVVAGDQVVGQMNELEKALNFLRSKYREGEKEIIDRLDGKGKPIGSEEGPTLEAQLKCCHDRFKIAEKLMWENIATRLAKKKTSLSTGLGLRSGGQIILRFGDNHDRDRCDKIVRAFMSRLFVE